MKHYLVVANQTLGGDRLLEVLRERFGEVLLSTLPVGVSCWSPLDIVSRVGRAVDVPVTHVIGEPVKVGS